MIRSDHQRPLEPVMPVAIPKQGNPEKPMQQANAVRDTIAQRMAPKTSVASELCATGSR